MSSPRAIISVADYLNLANHALRTIPHDGMVIEGEVADFKVSQGKWVNFDLKDEKMEVKIGCFMTVFALRVPLQSGMRVQITGYSKVFERFGKFTFNVSDVVLVGEGALQKAYEALKERLRQEGLFDVSRKRVIPRFPERIGLITSTEAAAYGDFLRILQNRWTGVTVVHTPVHVQGQYAVQEIISAFVQLNALPLDERPEVIVLTRGGGSLEDLHAFNAEEVARAVFHSVIPVLVGVGHERDESLCDFVADVRASTPSNAAECVVPDRREIESMLRISTDRMGDQLRYAIDYRARMIDRSVSILDRSISRITQSIADVTQRFGYAFERFRLSVVATVDHVDRRAQGIEGAIRRVIDEETRSILELERVLKSVDPREVLRRGYALVRAGNRVIRRSSEVAPGERLAIHFAEGTIAAVVEGGARQESLL
jgi:exodeoxyribonuclease VII large subunit